MRGWWGHREETGTMSKEIECKPKTMEKYTKKEVGGRRQRQRDSSTGTVTRCVKLCNLQLDLTILLKNKENVDTLVHAQSTNCCVHVTKSLTYHNFRQTCIIMCY